MLLPPQNVVFTAKGSQVYITWERQKPDVQPNWYVVKSLDGVISLSIEGWRTDYLSPELPGGTFTFKMYAINSGSEYSESIISPPLNFV